MLKKIVIKHPKKIIFSAIALIILWCGRALLPMIFLWGDNIRITFNLPDNIKLDVISAEYSSSKCKLYSAGTGEWLDLKRDHEYRAKEISKNKYVVDIYFNDYSLCQWTIESVYWEVQYKDIKKAYPQVSEENGGRGSEFPGYGYSRLNGNKWGETREGGNTIFITHYVSPVRKFAHEDEYIMRVPDGEVMLFKTDYYEKDGEFGFRTRHVEYRIVVEEPSFESIEVIE